MKKKKKKEESPETKLAKAQIALHSATAKLRQFVDQFERVVISIYLPKPRKKKRRRR